MSDFSSFSEQLRQRFEALSQHELYTVAITGDEVWAAYLAAFPEGTNPIFRERTEHDCSCCRQFIRNLGNVVAIIDGAVHTIWDDQTAPYPYNIVAQELGELVVNRSIDSLYRTTETKFGQIKSNELLADGSVRTWNHFHAPVDKKFQAASPAQVIGDFNTTVEVFHRGLNELTIEAFDSVVELIQGNNLYRGEEFLASVMKFRGFVSAYGLLNDQQKEVFVWENSTNPAARFRNTAIGTLLVDLSAGMELEAAVRSFESKVAPTNYKRTTALITPRMIEDAMKTIGDLGIREGLERRFAKLSDVSVNNVLWVDGSVQDKMKDGLAALLHESVAVTAVGKVEATPISIADFMANVVPKAKTISALVRNNLQKNLVSLTAPVHADARGLFKWDNNFAWSYNGNITDSIKEKVKAAGGNTNAALRISLAWFNADDLDLHVYTPGGLHIAWNNRYGFLDVDMNGMDRHNAEDPVENVSFRSPEDGVYRVAVDNYNSRRSDSKGFVIEVESQGQINQYSSQNSPKGGQTIEIGRILVQGGVVVDIQFVKEMIGGGFTQEKWGIKTEQYVKVETLMYSPNHWDDMAFGNRHWFFMLEGCLNNEPTRGIYNEFLDSALDKHRKVFEVLGAKTMCPPTAEQLSGLGFSSTKGESLQVQVTEGNRRNTYLINF